MRAESNLLLRLPLQVPFSQVHVLTGRPPQTRIDNPLTAQQLKRLLVRGCSSHRPQQVHHKGLLPIRHSAWAGGNSPSRGNGVLE